MKEAVFLPVISPKNDEDQELMIVEEDNVLVFYLDGKELFSGEWEGNFVEAFKRMIEIWSA